MPYIVGETVSVQIDDVEPQAKTSWTSRGKLELLNFVNIFSLLYTLLLLIILKMLEHFLLHCILLL